MPPLQVQVSDSAAFLAGMQEQALAQDLAKAERVLKAPDWPKLAKKFGEDHVPLGYLFSAERERAWSCGSSGCSCLWAIQGVGYPTNHPWLRANLTVCCTGVSEDQVLRKARRMKTEALKAQAALLTGAQANTMGPVAGGSPGAATQGRPAQQPTQTQRQARSPSQGRAPTQQQQTQTQQQQPAGARANLGPRLGQAAQAGSPASGAARQQQQVGATQQQQQRQQQRQQQQQPPQRPALAPTQQQQRQPPSTPASQRLPQGAGARGPAGVATTAAQRKRQQREEEQTPLRQKVQEVLALVPGQRVSVVGL